MIEINWSKLIKQQYFIKRRWDMMGVLNFLHQCSDQSIGWLVGLLGFMAYQPL